MGSKTKTGNLDAAAAPMTICRGKDPDGSVVGYLSFPDDEPPVVRDQWGSTWIRRHYYDEQPDALGRDFYYERVRCADAVFEVKPK
jgi:hypothetical protein